jgi:type I restriction enzyme R subunit
MLGAFPESMNDAVVQSMSIHENIAMKVLSNEAVAKGFAELML